VIDRPRARDEAAVSAAVSQASFFEKMKRQSGLRDLLKRRLSSELGVTFEVKVVERHKPDAAGSSISASTERRSAIRRGRARSRSSLGGHRGSVAEADRAPTGPLSRGHGTG
jgi:hypothetical protein